MDTNNKTKIIVNRSSNFQVQQCLELEFEWEDGVREEMSKKSINGSAISQQLNELRSQDGLTDHFLENKGFYNRKLLSMSVTEDQ